MKVLPIQDRALQKRKSLIEAGIAEFSEVGFDAATSKSIARRAGVATGTFYKNFDHKQELLYTIARQHLKTLHEQLNPEPDSASDLDNLDQYLTDIEDSIRFVYEFHEDAAGIHRVLEQQRYVDPELEQLFEEGEMVVRMRVIRLVLNFEVEHPEIVAENLYAMVEGVVHRHVLQLKTKKKEQVIREAAKVLNAYFVSLREEQLRKKSER